MARVLVNNDVSSLYPNLVRIYGYSSRNQKNKDSYIQILQMRMNAKHGKLDQDFLDSLNVTNEDIKDGLKLIINSFTGTLRAEFNALNDPLQGVSICFTGQCLLLQLGYDLMQIPTVHLSRFNTDAVEVSVEEEYVDDVYRVVHEWEELTKLEMEDDNIKKLVARDINNYAEIVETHDKVGEKIYKVNYKGSDLTRGNHNFKWNKEKKKFEYTFKDSLKSNSMTIVSEALLKKLLFDIPIETTINNCNDIFRFQIISHLGSTYEKCVQETPNGDIELQKNNRIYAGLQQNGNIIKVKPDGRRDSLANCPPNPIVDNANECTIDMINKEWYIEFTTEKYTKFIGGRLLEEYKKDELLELCNEYDIQVDKKTKKDELIKIIKNYKKCLTNKIQFDNIVSMKGDEQMTTKQELEKQVVELQDRLNKSIEQNEKLINKIKNEGDNDMNNENNNYKSLYTKINEFRKEIRTKEFIFDKELPTNLGGGEYYSIDQFYNAVQECAIKVGLDFSFETTNVHSFEKELVKPSGKLPIHVATVETVATLTDIDTGLSKTYKTMAQGSDTIDKAISGASTLAFRQWFYKNFTPKNMEEETINNVVETPKSEQPKVPVFIPEQKKEEIKKEVVSQVQKDTSIDTDLINTITSNVMKIRELTNDQEYGKMLLDDVVQGKLSTVDLQAVSLKIDSKLEQLESVN